MRKNIIGVVDLIWIFVFGFVVGTGATFLFFKVQSSEASERDYALVDFVIADWTGYDPSDERDESTSLAQFPSSKELPTSKLGFFPDTVRSLAAMVQQRYGVPAAVTLAQWALESGWGKRNLGASNYFGHTFDATKRFVAVPKFIVRRELVNVNGVNVPGKSIRFTSYTSIEECFDVHGKYLSQSNLYRAAFFAKDAEMFARIIALYYAQDSNYALKLITIMRRYNLV